VAFGLRLTRLRPGHAGAGLSDASKAWGALSAVLAAGALAAWLLPTPWLDWQPALAWREPWRAFTAAFVHWSPLHLGANLAATAVVAAYGLAARLPARAAWAWAAAWPLGHMALLLHPGLLHYGGLSGVLHGGVAVATLWIVATETGARRRVGWMVMAGLVVKLLLEEPWGPPLRHGGGWDIATAPVAHATGAAAGWACAACALWSMARRPSR